MKIWLYVFVSIFITSVISAAVPSPKNKTVAGADVLLSKRMDLIKGKRLGIVTNHSALLSNGAHLVDTLFHRKDVKISALFGPEHGIRGDAPDGTTISHGKDAKTGLEVYSLYGKVYKPTKEMLKDVDVLIYDIQDVGARFYTFISTLFYTVQAGAENNIPVIVLDRPNPITGIKVDGPVRKEDLSSFVGIAPIPIMHGLTIGELATLFNESGMLGKNLKAKLTVVKLENWKRDYYYDETGLKWVRPSPNIPDLETAIVYPGMCLIEGTNVSEGRGTHQPFLTFGAPYINSEELAAELKKLGIKGAEFEKAEYTPVEIPNMASQPKFQGEHVNGLKIRLTDRDKFEPVQFGIKLIYAVHKLYPEKFKFSDARFDRLSGDKAIREEILSNKTADEIIKGWQKELSQFKGLRKKYLLY
ncbi:MAG: exo-beta-N-acetylmuramidase NamZ domain-containing protein [Acidobacteriota bacterium]